MLNLSNGEKIIQGFRRIYFIANIEVNAASFDKIAKLLDFYTSHQENVAGDET